MVSINISELFFIFFLCGSYLFINVLIFFFSILIELMVLEEYRLAVSLWLF